ncbi:uncharacterized protein [Dermacentor albipictus]|uniref:uncharacterized protein isoform X1 n=1 Tax=Dermacentor albipictus TaxID=60249 RepID=UPI0038FCD0EB
MKISMNLLFVLFFVQSGYRFFSTIADATERRKTDSLDNPYENIVKILGFTLSLLLFPSMFYAVDRGLKYLLIIDIVWFVIVSSLDAFAAANVTAYTFGFMKEKSITSFAETTYQAANMSARIYMLWSLILSYHKMYSVKSSAEVTA